MQINKGIWHSTSDHEVLVHAAIDAATNFSWDEAIKINQKILTLLPADTEALNRLAYAFNCLGQKEKAEKTYKKVLEIDRYNVIAAKNLDKISKLNGHTNGNGHGKLASGKMSEIFLFEPGKTKIINLLNLAPPVIIATLTCGEKLIIFPKKHSVVITSVDGIYLGALPDDLAHRLIAFIAGGNKYEALVKYATTKTLTIFIKETSRSERFINQPSFTESQTNLSDRKGASYYE